MAESILVTGKKISSMELVTNVTGIEKIPTGQPDDLAITPNQIADHAITRGDLASHGDLSQVEVDLTTQIATLAGDVAAEDNSIRGLIAAEEAARIAGDGALQAAIDSGDTSLQSALDAEVAARIAADDLKVDKDGSVSSVAGRVGDVELTPSDVLVEGFGSQEDVNKYVPKPFLGGYTYGLGERVVLDNGDIVKSTVDGNVSDPNVGMTGWVRIGNIYQVYTVEELSNIQAPKDGDICNVSDDLRGGKFVYDSNKSAVNDGGLVFNGWVRVRETNEVRISWFGAKGDGVTDNSAAINKASAACGIDDLLVIDSGEYVIGSAITLPDCDINCEGSIVLKDAKLYTAVKFPDSETITVDVTKLSGFSKGNTYIQIEDGYLDDINLKDYFMLIDSPEVSVYRLDGANYTDYGKIETHDIISNVVTRSAGQVFTLSDPILFDFDDFSQSTVTLVKKKAHKTVKNLKITQSVAEGLVDFSDRVLLSLTRVSNKSFDNLLIDADSDKPTIKLRITDSCNIIFNRPRPTQKRPTGASSYTIVLYNTAYITFNDYVLYAIDKESGSCAARHANHTYFNGCILQRVGDHFGYNWYFDKCTIHDGISHAGINVTATNCTFINDMFKARSDAPNYGTLTITNCEVYQTSSQDHYRNLLNTTSNRPNPRGVPVVESFFDNVYIDNINVYTTDDSRAYTWLCVLLSVTSDSYLAANEDLLEFRTLNSFIFKNVKVVASENSTIQAAYITMRFPCKYTLIDNVTVTKADGSDGRVMMYNAAANIDPYSAWDAGTLLKSGRMHLKNMTFSSLYLGGVANEITIEDCVTNSSRLNNGYKNRTGTTVLFKSSLIDLAVDAPAATNGSRVSMELFNSTIDLSTSTAQNVADYQYNYYDINRIEGTYLTATSDYIPAALVGKLPSYYNPAKYKASLPEPITP